MENLYQFKIFVVDDDIFCANMHGQFLTNLGYLDITYFDNGNSCLENLERKPEIILLDHNMEDINGFEVLKKIKRYNPNIYIVMISGQDNIKTAVDALKYGAFDYVVKDNDVYNKIELTLHKIIAVKEQIKKSNPSLLQKVISVFF